MATWEDLITDAVAYRIGPCDFSGKWCVTHDSFLRDSYCRVMSDAIDAADGVVQAVLAELRRQVGALPVGGVVALLSDEDVVHRSAVLRLLGSEV